MGACESKINSSGNSSLAINEATVSDIQNKVSNRLKNNKNNTSLVSKTGSSVNIRQTGNESSKEFYRSVTSEKKGPFGIFGHKKNCPLFHCAYQINQSTVINIFSYNASLSNETENILNDIETSLNQEAETQLSGPGVEAINGAFSESRNQLREDIQSKLDNLVSTSHSDNQSIDIEYTTPLRCRDPCGLNNGPYGPVINQFSMFNFHSENIINSAMEIITNKFAEHDLEVTQTVSDENTECIIMLVIIAISCIICLLITWKVMM
jgi:hypothetical protein